MTIANHFGVRNVMVVIILCTLLQVVEQFVAGGSTVNICLLEVKSQIPLR